MKRAKKNRLLAFLLAVALLVAMLPTVAFAKDSGSSSAEVCTVSEGCTLEAGHEGDCVTEPAEPEETEQSATEEQLATLIAALPAPEDIDTEDEAQTKEIHEQIAEIYAYAEENGLGDSENGLNDAELNEALNAVIAALYPAETLEEPTSFITDNSGKEWSVTTEENKITMTCESTTITAVLSGGTLKISGNGAMPNLNKSTDTESVADGAGTYPWAEWKDSITAIEISDAITSIGSKAFIGYTSVTSVKIGKDVSEIGVGALSQLSACTSFDVSGNSNFTTDDKGALFDSTKTKLIAFPCGSSVTEYVIPATVRTIAYGAFSRAATLETVTIPEGSQLETIGYGAFAFTTALKTVNMIPASIETVGDLPFTQSGVKHIYCANETAKALIQSKVDGLLIDVLLSGETPAIEFTDDGYTYWIDDGEALVVSAPKDAETLTVPNAVNCQGTSYPVTGIWKGAFAISMVWNEANGSADKRNETITSVTLPDSITQIGERAFYFCKNLSTITIQASEVSVDALAFATQSSSGTTLDFSAVTALQSNSTNKWAGVSKVILNNEGQLDTIKANVRTNTVAVVGKDEWKMTSDGTWAKQPKTNLQATVDGITWTFDELDGEATITAYSPKTIENVTVPSTITTEDGATYTVTTLSKGLFGWTGRFDSTSDFNTSIKSVVIPETVTTIGADMFRYSQNLENVMIQGESITFESNRTFSGTSGLKILDMSSVKTVSFGDEETGYFSNITSKEAAVYVSSDTVESALKSHGMEEKVKVIFAVTDGGTFATAPTDIASAEPSKVGYTFLKWCEYKEGTADYSNEEAAKTFTAGKTYIAVYKECKHENGYTYTAKDNVLTQKCEVCGYVGTATLNAPETLRYDGNKKEAAVTTTENAWQSSVPTPEYYDSEGAKLDKAPSNAGTYTAKITAGSGDNAATASLIFTITKADQSISYGTFTVTKHVNDGAFTNELTKTTVDDSAAITYTSDDEKVATVDNSGNVTIKGAGTATITAVATETGNYNSKTAFYTLTVSDHTYGEYAVTKEAICTEAGSKEAICTHQGCNEKDTQIIPAKGHTAGQVTAEITTQPTANKEGVVTSTVKCSVCDVILSTTTTTIPALGYKKDNLSTEVENYKAPACTEAGSYDVVVYNTENGAKTEIVREHKTINATGHSVGTEWKSDGTNHWHVCDACGDKSGTATHTFKWVIDKEATATEKGSKHEECSVCGYKKDAVEIPAAGSGTTPTTTNTNTGTGMGTGTDNGGNASLPKTGDNSHPALWVFLLLIASGGMTGVIAYTRKRRTR